jgi:glycosyltransferase involved in cell wall biosynthesis
MDLSIVIPVMNEEDNIDPLLTETLGMLDRDLSNRKTQIIFVDDGSSDRTVQKLKEWTKKDARVKAVIFRKNFGKSAALTEGFERAEGKYVVTMDGDLQDDPKEVPTLLKKLDDGFDLVSGWKNNRKDPLEKRMASKVFNGVISRMSGVYIHDFNCGLKAYKNWAVKSLELRGNQYRFIPAILKWKGARVTELPVTHRARTAGKSKYGFKRYYHGAFDLFTLLLLTRFSQAPLYFFGLIGLPFLGLGAAIGLYLFVNHILYLTTAGMGEMLNMRPLLVISFSLMIVGLQIFLIGLLSELVLRVTAGRYYEIKEEI